MAKLISVGQLIDESWDLYKSRFSEFLSVSGWLILAGILEVIALAFYPSASTLALSSNLSGSESFGVLLYMFTYYAVTPLLLVFILTGTVRLIKGSNVKKALAKGSNVKKALAETKTFFLPTLLVTILVVLLVLLAQVIAFAPAILLSLFNTVVESSFILTIANIFLILAPFAALILTIMWLVYYVFAPFAAAMDGTQGRAALAQSHQLIKGRFWGTLLRFAIPKIVFLLVGVFAISVIAYLVQIVIVGSVGLNLDLHLRVTTLTQAIIPVLVAVFINPLIIIADTKLFQSLKTTR